MIVFRCVTAACVVALVAVIGNAQDVSVKEVSFATSDDGKVHALQYGKGSHGVVFAHGAVFNKQSWSKQSEMLAKKGFLALAIDFRGYGKSRPGNQQNAMHLDVLAAVEYLKKNGAKRVSVVGGSMGGGAAAKAAVEAKPDQIDRLILLAHSPVSKPEKMQGKKLFIVSSGDGIRAAVEKQYEAASEPKKLLILKGNAHAQHIFRTAQATALQDAIVDWLTDDAGKTPPKKTSQP